MFFSLAPAANPNYNNHYQLGRLFLSTDAGWSIVTTPDHTAVFKGYADEFLLAENLQSIIQQEKPIYPGNFCAFVHDHQSQIVSVKTDLWRSFPIFAHDDEITNLKKSSWVIWSDSLISISPDFVVEEQKFDLIGEITTTELSRDQVIESIVQILDQKTKKFLSHNRLPLRVHLSGGVDSLLVFSLIKKQTDNYELIKYQHFDYDRFWLQNESLIRENYWGYTQIHHWKQDCVLSSGAPGDEFMLRSPATIDLLLKYRGKSTLELLSQNVNCLHWDYFHREKHHEIFTEQEVDRQQPIKDFYWKLCNIVVNDWQHWHIGKTLTWTPLRDLEIFKLMLRLPLQDSIGQIFDSAVSKIIIDANVPGLARLISDQKNSSNPMKNLCDFLFDGTS